METFRDDRLVIVVQQFLLDFHVIVNLKEQHPRQLLNALRIAVDPSVVTRNVTEALDKVAQTHA